MKGVDLDHQEMIETGIEDDLDPLKGEKKMIDIPEGGSIGGMMTGIGTDVILETDTMTGIRPLEEIKGLLLGTKKREGDFIPHQGQDLIHIQDENTLIF
jgi:hypothetical protein